VRDPQDILVVVSSLHELVRRRIPFVFTDRHAYSALAVFASGLADLNSLRWPLLRASDFRRDEEDPGKVECYQAETLVHRHLPVEALQGIACYNDEVRQAVETTIVQAGASLKAVTRRGWYFS
jgi:ssDNA thymidine ADP-ribosyltransferase, DarT